MPSVVLNAEVLFLFHAPEGLDMETQVPTALIRGKGPPREKKILSNCKASTSTNGGTRFIAPPQAQV